ncbi:putative transcription factor interactor and regulator C2H2 family [Helianthus anomalus]
MMEGSANGYHRPQPHHRHHNLNRGLLFRVPRHNYNAQQAQRNLGQHSAASASHGKTNPIKFGHKSESRSGYTERKDKASRKQERIRSNRLVIDVVSGDSMKMICRLCSASTSDNSVVAVLVCGHFYHADCLETRTSHADRRDPPCPLCVNSHSAN